jgi:hypothetical protein
MHATFGAVDFAGHRTSWLVPVIGLSLVAAAFAYVAGIGAARTLGAKLASFVGLTEVLFAVLVAWLLLGELPTGIQLLGGILIVAGVALVRIDELRPHAPDPRSTVHTGAEPADPVPARPARPPSTVDDAGRAAIGDLAAAATAGGLIAAPVAQAPVNQGRAS